MAPQEQLAVTRSLSQGLRCREPLYHELPFNAPALATNPYAVRLLECLNPCRKPSAAISYAARPCFWCALEHIVSIFIIIFALKNSPFSSYNFLSIQQNLSIVSSDLNFFLKLHLQPMILQPWINQLKPMYHYLLRNLFYYLLLLFKRSIY